MRSFFLVVILIALMPVLAAAGALVGGAITALCVVKMCLELIGGHAPKQC